MAIIIIVLYYFRDAWCQQIMDDYTSQARHLYTEHFSA